MIEGLNFGEELSAGTKDVFSTMLMIELVQGEIVENSRVKMNSNLTSMIGLGGGLQGMLAIHCSAKVAQAITGAFLGMDVEEIDDDVKDAIGEIANMVAGNLKVSCATKNINVELAIPATIVGDNFTISGMADAKRVNVPLEMNGMTFWVELMYLLV